MKSLFKFFLIGLLSFVMITCDEEDPNNNNNNNPPPVTTPTGNLEVFIRKESPAGIYLGGVDVKLYKTQSGFDTDSVYRASWTPYENYTMYGAYFDSLKFQKYFIRASVHMAGYDYEGDTSLYVPVKTTTRVHLVVNKK